MPIPIPSSVALVSARDTDPFAQAQMAAAAYLARYIGRTLKTYRYDLRAFFQWCTDRGLECSRPHGPTSSCGRSTMEERGNKPAVIPLVPRVAQPREPLGGRVRHLRSECRGQVQ
jgi:hypothetical protein